MSNFHEPVSKFYQMDPATDEIAMSGYRLCDGMIVLIEGDFMRELTDEDRERAGYTSERNDYEKQRLIENNRWALVTQFEERRHHEQIKFVAVYADGTKHVRNYGESHEWYFKLNCTRTDALIVSEQEWEDMNASGISRDEFEAMSPSEQADVMGEGPIDAEPPWEKVNYTPIFRAQAAYLMCGDLPGEQWCNDVLSYHKRAGDILEYAHLSTVVGGWGMESVVFTFDFSMPDVKETWDNVKSTAEDLILKMVGDSDYTLIDVGITNSPRES